MASDEQFDFVQQLAKDVSSGDICLPSLPTVVGKIRVLLEQESCDFQLASRVVSADAALVSKLFVFANSAYHNTGSEEIGSLDVAIGRLGLDLVRSTAVSIAVKQLLLAEKHKDVVGHVRNIWAKSMRLSSMSYALAEQHDAVDAETAFMCGLLHEVGKLYILTKAKAFPRFLGDADSLDEVLKDWHAQIGLCIVEAWEFPANVVESMDPATFMDERRSSPPAMVDVVYAAGVLLDESECDAGSLVTIPACRKLGINDESKASIHGRYKDKLASVQQALS